MALIAVTSASGSPGASTTAWGMALNWGAPCLFIEADPTGSSALGAGYFRGEVMPTDRTAADLSIPVREGRLAEALPNFVGRVPGTETFILPGARGHAQAGGISSDIWAGVAAELTASTNALDTIVDTGRLGLAGSPRPVIAAADMTLLVLRNDLPGIIGAQSWARALREMRADLTQGLGLVLVTPGVRARRRGVLTSSPREIAKVLGLPVIATVPDAPDEAVVFSHGVAPARRRSALAEAYVAVGHRARLAIEAGVGAPDDDAPAETPLTGQSFAAAVDRASFTPVVPAAPARPAAAAQEPAPVPPPAPAATAQATAPAQPAHTPHVPRARRAPRAHDAAPAAPATTPAPYRPGDGAP